MEYLNVRFWLGTVLTDPDKQGPLFPQQQTFEPYVRFRADFVRFTPESRRDSGRSRESEVDLERTLTTLGA